VDRIYARDYLTQHLVDGQPLTAEDVTDIVNAGVAKRNDFTERLPHQWWHNSHPAFPEGWTEQDQLEVNRAQQ